LRGFLVFYLVSSRAYRLHCTSRSSMPSSSYEQKDNFPTPQVMLFHINILFYTTNQTHFLDKQWIPTKMWYFYEGLCKVQIPHVHGEYKPFQNCLVHACCSNPILVHPTPHGKYNKYFDHALASQRKVSRAQMFAIQCKFLHLLLWTSRKIKFA
jgi:hypothetical protein